MTEDEFAEYKAVIQGALDLVKFDTRVDIQFQNMRGLPDVIVVSSTYGKTVIISPAKHVFHVGCFESDNSWTYKEINLAEPDSLQEFGTFVKRIIGPSWA